MASKTHTLYSPEGKKYETTDAAEATRLRMAHGYSEKDPNAKSSKSSDKK